MTSEEKVQKLESVIQEAFTAMKMLPEVSVCIACDTLNKEKVEEIIKQIEKTVNLYKEIK